MSKKPVIILVEDNHVNQKRMLNYLNELYPECDVKIMSNGIEATNYLLSPTNRYDLVLLDGNLNTGNSFFTRSFNGPDVAEAMVEKGIKVTIVLCTNEAAMLAQFDKIFGKRLPEIEKPFRKTNVEVILSPLILEIEEEKKQEEVKRGLGA